MQQHRASQNVQNKSLVVATDSEMFKNVAAGNFGSLTLLPGHEQVHDFYDTMSD